MENTTSKEKRKNAGTSRIVVVGGSGEEGRAAALPYLEVETRRE